MAKILLVEDDTTFASILEIVLRGRGFKVEVANDGIEALRKAENFKPSLIILDINLPKLSGFEVAQKLREKDDFKDIPIIMLTAMGQEVNIKRGYRYGAEEYITKPFSIEHLLIRIKKYCNE